jgi:hypothetical protein
MRKLKGAKYRTKRHNAADGFTTLRSKGVAHLSQEHQPAGSGSALNQSFYLNKLARHGLDRIIEAVEATSQRKRKHSGRLSRDQLVLDLVGAYEQLMRLSELDSIKIAGEKAKLFKSTAKAAIALKGLLLQRQLSGETGEEYIVTYTARTIARQFEPLGFKAFLIGLDRVIDFSETYAQRKNTFRLNRGLMKMFVSEILPPIYERNFGSKAGFSRNTDGAPGGPYVRFAGAVTKEMERPISAATIIAALIDFRRGKGASYRKKGVSAMYRQSANPN